jgi:hypothetical protein
MWRSLLKIQYTELKLSCRNDPVVKYSIYSNGELDLMTRVNKSKVKVTVTINRIFDNRVVST